MSDHTVLLPHHPTAMSMAQLAAVSYLARYAGHTHHLCVYQLKRGFASSGASQGRSVHFSAWQQLTWSRYHSPCDHRARTRPRVSTASSGSVE